MLQNERMNLGAVRKLLKPMSDSQFEAWLRERFPDARLEDPEGWLAENLEALDSSNAYVEEHGLPLAKHRQW